MAMDLGGAGQGKVKSDINVTPLVDVMLVLLIIMMLVAPMLQKGVDVRLYVNGLQVPENDLLNRIQTALEEKREKVVLIKGDTDAPYSTIMTVMDRLREAQIEDIGLITEKKLQPGEGGE